MSLSGKHILVTAGPTHEPIDPVRVIANRSSGRQGFAVAAAVSLMTLVPVAAGTESASPRVSVISDSVLTAVTWGNDAAQSTLSQGLDLHIDAAVCRRLNGQSCQFNNAYAPTTLPCSSSFAKPRQNCGFSSGSITHPSFSCSSAVARSSARRYGSLRAWADPACRT